MLLRILFFGTYGDFSNIKSLLRNRMDDLNFFLLQYFYKVKTQQPPGGRLADF